MIWVDAQTGGGFRSLLALEVAGVPRRLRMEYPGAIYHVMDRGNRRESGSRLAGKEFQAGITKAAWGLMPSSKVGSCIPCI